MRENAYFTAFAARLGALKFGILFRPKQLIPLLTLVFPISPPPHGAADPVAVPAVEVSVAAEGAQIAEVGDGPVSLGVAGRDLRVEQVQEGDDSRAGGGNVGLES